MRTQRTTRENNPKGASGKKILLIRPAFPGKSLFGEDRNVQPPMNLVGLATFLSEKGIDAKIVDFCISQETDFRAICLKENPDIVGLGISSVNLQGARTLVSIAKGLGIPCIIGGPHATAFPEEALLSSGADYAIIGEGEFTLLDILSGKSPEKIPGLAFAGKGGEIRRTPERTPEENLDIFPIPDRRKYCAGKYKNTRIPGIYGRIAFASFSRGCPYSCRFCQTPLQFGKIWRRKSPKKAAEEFRQISEIGYSHLQIDDDIFGLDKKWLASFCSLVGNMGKKISWSCNMRADLVSEELLAVMKKAGCLKISFGVESGSERILRKMRKGISVAKIRRAFELTKKAGIMAQAYVIVGYPGETRKDISLTKKLLFEISPDVMQLSAFAPLPGTPAYYEALENGLYSPEDEEFSSHGYYLEKVPCGTGALSREEVAQERNRLYRDFYLRPSYVLKRILRARNLGEIGSDFFSALSILKLKRT